MRPEKENIESEYEELTSFEIQRLRKQIVTQISHEFRTPLTSIIGFADMLEEGGQIDEKHRIEYARNISNEGKRLAKLVNNIIELDSIEQGRVDLHFELSKIQEIAQCAVLLITELAKKKSVDISVDLPDEPILAKVDQVRITQVLFELLYYAILCSDKNDRVILKISASDRDITFSIQDNGHGVAERDVSYLLKKFRKFNNSDKEDFKNSVGLFIVKHIVEQHKGSITVRSHVGKGLTFVVCIPILN